MEEIKVTITKDGEQLFEEKDNLEEIVGSYLVARIVSDDKSPEMVAAIAELYRAINEC